MKTMASLWTGTGLPVVISSPSGGGKTTVIKALRKRHREFLYSVSVTTRVRRRGERDGVHYRFITEEQFSRLRSRGLLAESASVHDRHYGTPQANLKRAYRDKRVMLFDLDVQGAAQLSRCKGRIVTIFLLPPTMAILRERLVGRGSESPAERRRRFRTAQAEMKRYREYQYLITNDRLDRCVSDCEAVIRAEILCNYDRRRKPSARSA